MHPLVSVITPSFNSEGFIKQTYNCLTEQSISDWEWVVTDDGSSDNTPELLRRLKADDPRVNLELLNSNAGPAVARNHSIERANGRYLAFLDADDQWLPEKLEKQIAFMKENDYAFTHTWYQPIDSAGKPVGKLQDAPRQLNYPQMLKSNQVGCLTAIYDTKKLGKIYMPLIRKRQDYGLWLRILKETPYVYCYPESLSLYRVAGESISSNKVEMLKFNWQLYRDVEKFSYLRAAYYLMWNVIRKLTK